MKENVQKLKETEKRGFRAEETAKETGERPMRRRDFLKLLGTAAGTFALKGFHGIASAADVSPKKEQEQTFSLEEQWKSLVRAAIKDLETRPGLYWQGKEVKEVKDALPAFDIAEFLRTLAENSGIPQKEITARLENFSIKPPDPDHPFHMGDMNPRSRAISVFLSPLLFQSGRLDQNLFFLTIRHELTHAVSVDYQTSDQRRRVPWLAPQEPFSIFISPYFYEGATELISLRASPEKRYQKDMYRPYNTGATLSAYVIARLVGEQEFTKSYLKKDPLLLARAMDEKIGEGAALALTEPINMQLSWSKEGSLDVLHNIFKHEHAFDLLRVKDILRDAWQEGIDELVAYKTDGGVKITMDLFPSFEGGKKFFSVAAAAEGPVVTRFRKSPRQETSQRGVKITLPRHHVSVAMRQTPMGKRQREENINSAAETLRSVLWDEDPYNYREQSLLILGFSKDLGEALALLNRLDTPSSPDFQDQWLVVQDVLKNEIIFSLKEVYEQAGVTEEQYTPHEVSPLSSAQ